MIDFATILRYGKFFGAGGSGSGGSGGVQVFKKSMSINGAYNSRVSVDFGFKPDLLLVYPESYFTKTNTGLMLFGTTKDAADKLGISSVNVRLSNTTAAGGVDVKSASTSIDCDVSTYVANTAICGCDETGFTIGRSAFYTGWVAIVAMKLT